MKSNIRLLFYIVLLCCFCGLINCGGSSDSTRYDALKNFASETSIVTYEGHQYLLWIHTATRPDGTYTYVSGLTHSASCPNPEHKQLAVPPKVAATPTVTPTPRPDPQSSPKANKP